MKAADVIDTAVTQGIDEVHAPSTREQECISDVFGLFQVFEHETIMVGETRKGVKFDQKHFVCLSERLGKKDDSVFPFYSLVKYRHTDGIKFKQYVGAIQAKDLTIEILPYNRYSALMGRSVTPSYLPVGYT